MKTSYCYTFSLQSFISVITFLIAINYYIQFFPLQKENEINLKTYKQNFNNNRCKVINVTHSRCLANILFIGASKCGTTSLVSILSQHPNVKFVRRRYKKSDNHNEVHRFDRRSFQWSLKSLELQDEWQSSPIIATQDVDKTAVIHYTPHYLYAPTVPFDIRDFYPHWRSLKFIVMLRNPLERAVSSYWFKNSHKFHPQDQGTVDDFFSVMERELTIRQSYETCMGIAQGNQSLTDYWTKKFKDLFGTSPTLSGRDGTGSRSIERVQHLHDLQRCFGNQVHSKWLGWRHLDKGVYIDQFYRWFLNFHPTDMFQTSSTLPFVLNDPPSSSSSFASPSSSISFPTKKEDDHRLIGNRFFFIGAKQFADTPVHVLRSLASFMNVSWDSAAEQNEKNFKDVIQLSNPNRLFDRRFWKFMFSNLHNDSNVEECGKYTGNLTTCVDYLHRMRTLNKFYNSYSQIVTI